MAKIYGNTIGGGGGLPKSFVLETEDGSQKLVGVTVGEETVFDATPNDVREGKVYAGDDGIKIGEKNIPSYHTHYGSKLIAAGKPFVIINKDYNYTTLQAIICSYNGNIKNSLSTNMVAIADNIYAVQSTESIALIQKNHTDGTIEFGITNDTDKPQIIKYIFTKEIY